MTIEMVEIEKQTWRRPEGVIAGVTITIDGKTYPETFTAFVAVTETIEQAFNRAIKKALKVVGINSQEVAVFKESVKC